MQEVHLSLKINVFKLIVEFEFLLYIIEPQCFSILTIRSESVSLPSVSVYPTSLWNWNWNSLKLTDVTNSLIWQQSAGSFKDLSVACILFWAMSTTNKKTFKQSRNRRHHFRCVLSSSLLVHVICCCFNFNWTFSHSDYRRSIIKSHYHHAIHHCNYMVFFFNWFRPKSS